MAKAVCPAATDMGADFRQHEIYINLPDPLPDNFRTELIALQENVRTAFSWATNIAIDLVRKKLEAGQLPADDKHAQSAYRAKVITSVFSQRAAWLSQNEHTDINNPIDVKRTDFNVNYLLNDLSQLRPAPPGWAGIADVLKSYGESVKSNLSKDITKLFYWLAIAYFTFDAATRKIGVDIEISDIEVKTTRHNQDSLGQTPHAVVVDMVKVEPTFAAVQYGFNNETFEKLKDSIQKTLHDMALVNVRG